MKYRSEIDGLRAVAVTIVVLYHAGFKLFSGGFVGVDVFFVISGYLITTIILDEVDADRFSLRRFYERRARRILPALIVVILASIPAAWVILLPGDLNEFASSLIGVSVFASNIFFARDAGYFSTAAELKPFLHMWSLAVEEQFYVIVPLVIMTICRFGTRVIFWIFCGLLLASFVAGVWATLARPNDAFFLLQYRGWELLMGCSAAAFVRNRSLAVGSMISNALSFIGLVLIFYAALRFDASIPFPGIMALVPTIGAMCIVLFARPGTFAYWVLSRRVFVGIGLISYSAYLWHQPLFSFARHLSVWDLSLEIKFSLIFATFVLAYFTWKFVEQPFRRKPSGKFAITGSHVLPISGAGLITMLLIAVSLNTDTEDPMRPNRGFYAECYEGAPIQTTCKNLNKGGDRIIILGDSYAMHLSEVLFSIASNSTFMQISKDACSPALGFAQVVPGTKYTKRWAKDCINHNLYAFDFIKKLNPSLVVLGSPFANTIRHKLIDINGEALREDRLTATVKGVSQMVDALLDAGHSVVIVQPPHNSGIDLGRCVWMANKIGLLDRCTFSENEFSQRTQDAIKVTTELSKKYKIFEISEAFCKSDRCVPYQQATALFRDTGHLSIGGSKLIGDYFTIQDVLEKANHPAGHAANVTP